MSLLDYQTVQYEHYMKNISEEESRKILHSYHQKLTFINIILKPRAWFFKTNNLDS